MTTTEPLTVRFVDVEQAPNFLTYGYGGFDDESVTDDALRVRIQAIEPDSERCAACKEPVGVVLVGDEDKPTWRWVTAVARTTATTVETWLLCEDCATALSPAGDS